MGVLPEAGGADSVAHQDLGLVSAVQLDQRIILLKGQ
jgi:hypothetical protein